MSIPILAEQYGLSMVTTGRTVTLHHLLATITFNADSRQMRFNGTLVWLNDGVRLTSGRWSISKADAATVLAPLLTPEYAPPIRPPARVVLDPGHGGDDSGAKLAGRIQEKDLNLAIVLLVADRLRRAGVSVWTTRNRDTELPLSARPRTAERVRADLFVSVHMNSATNRDVAGVETYLMPATGFISTIGRSLDTSRASGNKYDVASQLLAYDVHRATLARTEAADRGVRRARFDVLSLASCPAILVECGFLSNAREADMLATDGYREKLAEGISQGIMTYLSRCEAQARRLEPVPPPVPKPEESNPGTAQTNRTDHAVQAQPPGDTER